jgi:hypothetical protein
LLLAIAVSALGISCGGGLEADSPTGVSALPDFVEENAAEVGEVSASGKNKVLICHKGKDKKVPESAVPGHLGHGDTLGSCAAPEPDPNPCPCYTADQVAATAACPGAVTQCVRIGAGYLCRIVCSGTNSDFFLDTTSCQGPQVSSPVDSTQYDACLGILQAECPSFTP